MSEAGNETRAKPGEPESMQPAAGAQGQRGFLGSWLDTGAATSGAWSLWESVKNSPKLAEAQQQAQQVLQQYDTDSVRSKLAELSKSATDYIDEADRRLETLEVGAVNYLQKRSTEIVDKVRLAATGPDREGEVLFNGPERAPVSRLDAELQALHTSPDRIRAKTDAPAAGVAPGETAERLAQYPELAKLHAELAPELGESEFWNRYVALRSELERQDSRRKMLIESQSEDMFEGWGSSDEEHEHEHEHEPEHEPAAAGAKRAAHTERTHASTGAAEKTPRPREPIDEEASDLDWE